MTSKHNLGPVLALTGAGIALAAVIAGFVLVGGPGDAREQRLDEMTMDRVTTVLSIAQCAYNATGAIPASIEAARTTRAVPPSPDAPAAPCGTSYTIPEVTAADRPAAPGNVTYNAADATHIKICGNFRRPKLKIEQRDNYRFSIWAGYPQLTKPRPAGVHCFDLELLKGVDLTRFGESHAGHMDVFE